MAGLATLAASRTKHLEATGHSTAVALTGGYHLAFQVGTIAVAAGLVLAIALARAPRGGRDEVVVARDEAEPAMADVAV